VFSDKLKIVSTPRSGLWNFINQYSDRCFSNGHTMISLRVTAYTVYTMALSDLLDNQQCGKPIPNALRRNPMLPCHHPVSTR